ncbi:MAG: DUF2591 domain-containing protein [Ramlibacter sp.]|nr:DUF2591 domain-containing protein [Ramlibacter sp.]
MKTAELTGALLDYWVAKALGKDVVIHDGMAVPSVDGRWRSVLGEPLVYEFSTNWGHGGPIIDRSKIAVRPWGAPVTDQWAALVSCWDDEVPDAIGPTPLIAAMRAKVASVYGNEVPEQ